MSFGEAVHFILAESIQMPYVLVGVDTGCTTPLVLVGIPSMVRMLRDRNYLERIDVSPDRLANATHLVWGAEWYHWQPVAGIHQSELNVWSATVAVSHFFELHGCQLPLNA